MRGCPQYYYVYREVYIDNPHVLIYSVVYVIVHDRL